jgi:SAM-dependent methyltransferase
MQPVAFACPACQNQVTYQAVSQVWLCAACLHQYAITQHGQPDFRYPIATSSTDKDRASTEKHAALTEGELDETERWQNHIKMILRQSPGLYRFLVYTIGTALYHGLRSQQFVNNLGSQARVLSVGAGVLRLDGHVIHLDYEAAYTHLEVIGDAHQLPFGNNTFDGVVCETLLEHVLEPQRVIDELFRVLKPGGKAYILMPFLFAFHAAPNDFYRMTHRGLAHHMRAFRLEQLTPFAGPASTLNNVLVEFMALCCSLGSKRLYRFFSLFFLVLFAPVKLLDFLLCLHPEALRLASIVLCVAEKPALVDENTP